MGTAENKKLLQDIFAATARGESWDRSGMLLTAPTAGGPTVQVASGTFIRRIAIDASTLYWITRDVADVPGPNSP